MIKNRLCRRRLARIPKNGDRLRSFFRGELGYQEEPNPVLENIRGQASDQPTYLKPPSKRLEWMAVNETLELFQCRHTPKGRRDFAKRLDDWICDYKREPHVHHHTNKPQNR